MALVHYFPEKRTLGILLPMEVPLVARIRDEVVFENPNDFRVGEDEPTARYAVVSSAAQRVAVHDPHEYRLTLPRSRSAGFGQVRYPRNLCPPFPFSLRGDRRMKRLKRGGVQARCGESGHVYTSKLAASVGN